MRHVFIFLFLLLKLSCSAASTKEPLRLQEVQFESSSGLIVKAQEGSLRVPENRQNPASDTIAIHFIRLKSTNPNPAAPVLYLEGGPGASSSWQAQYPDFLESWLPYLAVSDVILLDQRGTGAGAERVRYVRKDDIPGDILANEAKRTTFLNTMSQEALQEFKARGVDLMGYTTLESVHDIEALRKALAFEKITLFGFSYGTHLGQAYMKYFPEHVENAVLVGTEGLNHTVKLPVALDRQLAKIGLLAQADANVSEDVPDLVALYRQVTEQLAEQPAKLSIKSPLTNEPMELAIGPYGLQLIMYIDMGDASDIPIFPRLLYTIAQGDYSLLQWFVQKRIGAFYGVQAMSAMMEAASGASAERKAQAMAQLEDCLFKELFTSFLTEADNGWPDPDLGAAFRAQLNSNIRTLFLSGTLDSNTPPYQAEEVRWGFPNSTHIVVQNSGHEQILRHPKAASTIVRFLQGEAVDEVTMVYPEIRFIPVRGESDIHHRALDKSN